MDGKKLFINSKSLKIISAFVIIIFIFYGLTNNRCNLPISFSVGKIDDRFGLNRDDFSEIIRDSSERWNETSQNELFSYKAEGGIKVNLVFDKRQERLERLRELQSKVETYENDLSQYNSRVTTYNINVDIWNSSGGAPSNEYKKLETTKKELDAVRSDLQSRAKELQKEAKPLNLDAMMDDLKFNNLKNLTDKEIMKLAQGFYIEDQSTGRKEINIFTFENKNDLLAVVMHEMGHSLGIEDSDASNSASIMYFYNGGSRQKIEDPKPTNEDTELVNKYCGRFSFIDRWLESMTIYSR